MMESKPLPPIPKARLVKHAKPNVPTKPTFLRNQQLNKPSNKTLMLITSKDGELSVIKSSNSPPIAPKPKSTFHVRVQQHGNKLQVCPVGHYVEVNSNELEVCSLKNDFYWSILQKNKLEKKELEESCKIEKGVHKSVEVCPIPAPRKISNETSNENTDQSNAEGRHDFENVRANIIPVPSPRSQVNVKLQRRLFEKMLHSKDNEEKSSDILHSNDSSKKTPKKADKLSSKTFSHRRMPSRQTKKYASQQPNKPRPRSMESPSVEFPPKPSSRVRKENTNLQHTDILTDLAKITAAETIPKPSPREMSISMHSKTDNARSAIAPPLSPKPCHRSIPEQPNSKPNFQVSPVEPSSQLILSNVKSKDMPTEDIPKTTANLSNTKKHATTLCAKQNIPKIRISDESSDNQVYCEHLENIEIENIKVTNKRNTEECTTTGVEVDSTIDHKSETSIEHGVLNKSNNQSGNVVIIQNRSESNSDMYPFVVLYPNKSYSDEYTDVEINPDRSKNLSDSGEEPDSDLDDPDYVNCKEDHDDFNEDYVNGDFLDSCSNPAGEYMNFEDAKSCQSTEDNLVEEPPYVNHGISAESCGKDNDALCGDTLEGHKTEENSKKTCGTRTECYEVVLDVSNSKSISNKYRRFSCRQPGRRRKSNFNKQSHLKIDNVDDGSDYKSSQEDITDCLNNEYEEEIVEYSKDEFNDAEEEDEGWQSVDSSDLDHDERTSKRSFHHVLTITPDSTESGVSSGHPSPSRLSSATSDVPRVNSCVSFGSSDGFEDGSVRSSISQFSLSDELEGINTNQSFEDDEFTDNEIYDIMKRESTLSDSVPELDMEALKNDTMIQINKMRKKLAEMKRNVAKKNRRSVSLVSNEGFDLSENVQSSKERNKDVNKLNGRKAVSRKLNVASLSNRNNQGITSAQNNRHGDLQGSMNNLNLQNLLTKSILEPHNFDNQLRLGTTKHNNKIDYSKAMKVPRQSTISDSSGNYDHIRIGKDFSFDSAYNDNGVSDNYDRIRIKPDDTCNVSKRSRRFRNSKTRTSRGISMDYEDLDAWTKLSLEEQAHFLKRQSNMSVESSHDYEDVYHHGNQVPVEDKTFYPHHTAGNFTKFIDLKEYGDVGGSEDSGVMLYSAKNADIGVEECDYEYISGDESQLEAPTLPPRRLLKRDVAPALPPPLVTPRKNLKRVRSRRSVRRRPSRRVYGRKKVTGTDEAGPHVFRKRSQHVTTVDRSLAAQKCQHIRKSDDIINNRCCGKCCNNKIPEEVSDSDSESKYISIIYPDNEESEDDETPLPVIPVINQPSRSVIMRRPRSGSVIKPRPTLAALENSGNFLRERSFSEGTMRRGIRRKHSDDASLRSADKESSHVQPVDARLRRKKFAYAKCTRQREESVESAIYLSAELDDEEAAKSRRLSMESYVDPDELTTTSRHQALRTMENHASWKLGSDGPPPVPPRTPSLKQLPILSVHNSKTHSAGAVLDSQKQRSKKDLQSRRQSRFVRKEPLFQAYNKDAKLRDTLHFTEYRKQLSVDRDSPPPLPPPRRQSSAVSTLKIGPKSHLLTPEGRSMSLPEIEVENVNRKPSLKMQRTLWCEVPEVAESGILDQIDDKSRKLQEAMFEVITSEASYLRSLDIFLNNFYKADVLSTSYGLIRKEERHHLFSNLISVRDASERLLLDLEDRFQENFMISDVCDIIIKHATQRNFDMYVTYCLNNQYQVKTLKSLKENPTFVTELGILERSKECGGNNLQSFIMLPFQRITRLPLLIDAIIARLEPDSEKIGTAMEALNLVKKVAIKCNEEARRMEGIEEITKLAHKLDYKPNIKAIKISDKLLIVKRGDLQWFSHDTSRFNKKKVVSKQIHVLVFADKVVLTKRKIKNDREVFEVFDWCPRNLVDVKSVELKYDTLVEDYKNVMMVVFLQNHEKKEKKYFINTSSDANFQRWSDALAPPNRSDQGESIYESWDCPQVMCTQAYNAQEPDELSMEESDIIDVLRKTEGWWEGMRVRDSAKGWFPANQVQEIVNDHVRARNLKHRYKVLSVCQEQLQKLQMQGKEV